MSNKYNSIQHIFYCANILESNFHYILKILNEKKYNTLATSVFAARHIGPTTAALAPSVLDL